MPKPNNQINQEIRDSTQFHISVDIPPHDIFGLRIGCCTNGTIEVFQTTFSPFEHICAPKKQFSNDALNFAESTEGFDDVCVFEYAATIDIDEFLPRMEAFIASLKILKQSGLHLDRRFVEFGTTEDE